MAKGTAGTARSGSGQRAAGRTTGKTTEKTTEKAAEKAAASKTAAQKTAAKKAAAKKSTAKRSTAKRSTAKKTATKKSTARTSTAKTSTAKKTATKKTAAKTSTAKKTPAKAAATKTSAKAAAEKTGTTTARKAASTTAQGSAGTAPKPAPEPAPQGAAGPAAKRSRPAGLAVLAGEQPWTRAEVDEVRGELDAERERLLAEIASAEDDMATLLRDGGEGAGNDQADIGSTALERDAEMSLANNTRDMLFQVDRAKARLADGSYGVCESCGNPIGKARLMAFPRATLCMSCKQRQERR